MILVKVTLLFAAALFVAFLAKRATAATRHAVLAGALLAALILPLLALAMPPLPVSWAGTPLPRQEIADAPIDLRGEAAPVAPRKRIDWLMIVYAAGVASILASRAIALTRAFAIARRATPFGADVFLTGEVDQPSTFGRRILLPRGAETWSAERLRVVLLHERAHVQRRDTLIALLGDAACAVYWIHPLAWIVASRARLERERACDDAVLDSGIAARDYAAAILDVARDVALTGARPMMIAMAEHSQLGTRIRAILDPRVHHHTSRAAVLAVLAMTLASAPLLAAITNSVARPRAAEPDLRGDAIASPFSERLPLSRARERVAEGRVRAADAALVALLETAASKSPRHDIDFVPERARWALSQMRDGELVAPLIDALRDDDWRVRAYAAWALGYSRDRRATAPLIALLDDPVWRMRAMAAHALAKLGDPAAERDMLGVIDDDAWQVRLEVVRYLGKIGGHRAELTAMRDDRHVAVRAKAHEALEP